MEDISYCSQTSWILNDTIRNNIILSSPFNEVTYNMVLKVSQLETDLLALKDGDSTEIGTKGINLSGGQKQRLSLARALYNTMNDIYIFDDILSAIDVNIGNKIFKDYMRKYLKDKTRIFVTHQIQFLSQCDHFITMENKDGKMKCTYYESYSELVASGINLDEFINQKLERKSSERLSEIETDENDDKNKSIYNESAGKLIENEERETGYVKLPIYQSYIQKGGTVLFSIFVFFFFISQMADLCQVFFISYWTDNVDTVTGITRIHNNQWFLNIILVFELGIIMFLYVYYLCMNFYYL